MGPLLHLIINIIPIVFSQSLLFPTERISKTCIVNSTGEVSVCKSFRECPSAIKDWKKKKIKPTHCHFIGKEEIICCPKEVEDLIVQSRMSDQKCHEMYGLSNTQTKSQEEIEVVPPKPWFALVGLEGKIGNSSTKSQQEIDKDKRSFASGGLDAKLNEFLFMAAIGWVTKDEDLEFKCGGVLISPTYVLTAAHCNSLKGVPPEYVRIGGRNLTEWSNFDIYIKQIIVHPKYNPNQVYHDIALFELAVESTLPPACLWQNEVSTGDVTAIGFGQKEFAGTTSHVLQKVNLTIFNKEECAPFYPINAGLPNGLAKEHLCAGDYNGGIKDTCQGDSGGPIFKTIKKEGKDVPFVVGITSFGLGCAGGIPGVYVKIHEHLSWIEKIVWK